MSRTRNHNNRQRFKVAGWRVRMYCTSRQRASVRNWERETSKTSLKNIEDVDDPSHGKKDHPYYFW